MLWLESLSGKCAKLHTGSQQGTMEITWREEDRSIIAYLHHLHMNVILRAHPVCGKLHIQRNANWEVATTSPPIHNEMHQSPVLYVKVAPDTTLSSWSQHHFVAIGKPERQVRKASHCGSNRDQRSLFHCLLAPFTYVILRAHHVCGESYIQRNTNWEFATVVSI